MKKLVSLLLACMMLVAMTSAFADVSTVTDSYAVYAATAPVIDGVIDDMWAAAPEQWTYKEFTEDIGQAYGYTKVMWDEGNLYFLAVVYDYTLDVIMPGNTANGVNFWVSETDNATPEVDFVLPGDWHIYANPYAEFNYYTGNKEALEKGIAKATIDLEAEIPCYIVELQMPAMTEGLTYAEGATIGYDVSIDDDADGDGARDVYAAWSYYGWYWSRPSELANVQLVKEVPAQ